MREQSPGEQNASCDDEENPATDYISALVKYGTIRSGSHDVLWPSDAVSYGLLGPCSDGTSSFASRPTDDCTCGYGISPNLSHVCDDVEFTGFIPVVESLRIGRSSRCDVCLACLTPEYAKCKSCNIRVHATCYGLMAGDETFICDVCNAIRKRGITKPKCHLCMQVDGAMRYTENEELWVHPSCVLFAPRGANVKFEDRFKIDKPRCIKRGATGFSRKHCDVCGQSKGLMVSCSYPNCFRFLHSRCAMQKNFGKIFCECVSYKSRLNRQYFVFKGVMCRQHVHHEFIQEACQFSLKRKSIIRPNGRSSFQRYYSDAEDLTKTLETVSAGNFTVSSKGHARSSRENGNSKMDKEQPHAILEFYPSIHMPKTNDREAQEKRSKFELDEWLEYFSDPKQSKLARVDDDLPFARSHDEELYVQTFHPADVPELDISDSTVAVVAADAVGGGQDQGNQFRRPRLIWQRFDIFKCIPFGPCAPELLNANDSVTRRKSVKEYVPLNTHILSIESTDLDEMSECFTQQVLAHCRGIHALLESVKLDMDIDARTSAKGHPAGVAVAANAVGASATSSAPSLQDRKTIRLYVLVDTGIACGVLIYRVSRRLLEHLSRDLAKTNNHDEASSASNISFYMDDETRQIIAQVQGELVRNAYVSSALTNARITPGKELDFISGVLDFGLKDDLRYLNTIVNGIVKESEANRIRKKLAKKNVGPEPSLRNLHLEIFIPLDPLECEILKRCAFEMTQSNDVTLKLAVMKDMIDAAPSVECLGYIDWSTIITRIKQVMGDNSSRPMPTTVPSRNTLGINGGNFSIPAALDATATLATVGPSIRLGKWHWPEIEDSPTFLQEQISMLLEEVKVVVDELQDIREGLRQKVLEENKPDMKLATQTSLANAIMYKYEAVDRWSELVNAMVRGCVDIVGGGSGGGSGASSAARNSAAAAAAAAANSSATSGITSTPNHLTESRKTIRRTDSSSGGGDNNFCSVCFSCLGTNLNPIYTCSRCFTSCHRNCYGVGRAGKEVDPNEYICKRCEYEKRVMGNTWQTAFRSCSVVCSICGRGGGALKRCSRDEWCHVFCLLSLMPETRCSDYTALEPWDITNIAPWRTQVECKVCGVMFGCIMRCSDCDLVAHPFCAWFHGFKFKASRIQGIMSRVDSRDPGLFPRLKIEMTCTKHDDLMKRDWSLQMTIRNKRFINRDTNFAMFEGRDKRRKVGPGASGAFGDVYGDGKGGLFGSAAAGIGIAGVNPDGTLVYSNQKCQVCFGFGALWQCSKCKMHVHPGCYQEEVPETSMANYKFACDVCKNSDTTKAKCCICKRNSNILKQIPLPDQRRLYIHIICGICFPSALVSYCKNTGDVAEPTKNEACEICTGKTGLKIECFRRDCSVKFHPICGLENRFVVEPHTMDVGQGGLYVAFCQDHSLVNNSVGNNIKLLLRFRQNLLMLDKILMDYSSLNAVQRSWFRKRLEILNATYPLDSLVQASQVSNQS